MAAIVLTFVAACSELGGVGLIVVEVRAQRRRWLLFQSALLEEQAVYQQDPRWGLDPLVARYGLRPSALHRTTQTVEHLVAVDVRRQVLAVVLLVVGIVAGALANMIGALG